LDKDKINELRDLSKPLIAWLEQNCNPHTLVLIDAEGGVKLLSVEASTATA